MSNLSYKISNLFEKIKNNKKVKYALLCFVLLIVLIVIIFSSINKNNTAEQNVIVEHTDFVSTLENKLSQTLSKVDGVGKVSVVITVKSGMETVLAMKTTTTQTVNGTETIETPIIVNGETIIVKEVFPEITGVLIVAEGAENIMTMQRLQQATMSLLNVKIDQIEILGMK